MDIDRGNDLLELLAVLPRLDGLNLGSDEFDAVLLKDARSYREIAVFNAVWPPSVGNTASGCSAR